jgi:hypothetical protein
MVAKLLQVRVVVPRRRPCVGAVTWGREWSDETGSARTKSAITRVTRAIGTGDGAIRESRSTLRACRS